MLTFVRFNHETAECGLTNQLVECYRQVFATEPWNEWLKCPNCQRYWGIADKPFLTKIGFQHCRTPLVEFWPADQVLADIKHEITNDSSCWLALAEQIVVGFCWGYPIQTDPLIKKLGIDLDLADNQIGNGLIAYQDEVGVIADWRGQKIAKVLVRNRLDDFLARGLKFGLVRTRMGPTPSITYLWYTKKLEFKTLAQYPGDDGRVILGRELQGLRKLLI
ncbi:MAG: GNAT family N-acetyltransferase [Candidatus Buchananbacteria bacterium]|nr:GNAT family N-acetyltransferase [Candidatus Buchananbacteria bacterium]